MTVGESSVPKFALAVRDKWNISKRDELRGKGKIRPF